MKTVTIFDITIGLILRDELINEIVEQASATGKAIVGHVNAKALNIAYEDEKFARFFEKCKLVYSDGFGPLLGAKILGYEVKKSYRHSCPDFLDSLLSRLEERQKKIYFLGGTRQVIHRLQLTLDQQHPGLNFKAHHGFFEKTGTPNEAVIDDINTFNPDVLYVGFGMPLQEYWILENFDSINAHVFLPQGACLDFYTQSVYRGPKFLTDSGFEWLTRLLTEPGRLGKRYLVGNPKFLYRICSERLKAGK